MTQPTQSADRRKGEADRRGRGGEPPPSVWEWLAGAVGLLLLVASVGYLLLDGWNTDAQPPSPRVQVVAVQPHQGRYLVHVKVSNDSRASATAVRIRGELRRGGEVVESREIELQYLPGKSSREGGLYFTQDPGTYQLVLSALSYQPP